ncbi:glycosyltransferase family 39 protein [Clostridium sp. C8-1-8]|uniref:ArnT family glycosyltransferase n=1 Tax=Clostridium sp. C8-1-8 TaxID=2698831 RepID=UPI00136E3E88|nr:glycosyltransferase family 39 protein [Clostridium sp. C8-1-8]
MNVFNTKPLDRIIKFIERLYYLLIILILIVACFNIFYRLGVCPIRSWDEARHGVSAYEMIKSNNYIVNTYGYSNDYWNLKPPISFWSIVIGYKLAGYTTLGLRLLSAIAGLATIFIVAWFSFTLYGRIESLVSTVVMTTTMPYIIDHCARSGDPDSIYVLFFTIAILSLILFERNKKWLYVFGVAFAFAFLTKSWHAGNIIVIGIIYFLLRKKLFKIKIKYIIGAIISAVIPVLVWIVLRYQRDGLNFINTMVGYDLIARSSSCLEGHTGGLTYYVDYLQGNYFYCIVVFVSGILSFFTSLKKYISNKIYVDGITLMCTWVLVPFILYSIVKTKINWYILPIYPAMAIAIGITVSIILKEQERNILSQLFIIAMVTFSVYKYEVIISRNISIITMDSNQELMKVIGNNLEYKGKPLYMYNCEREQNVFLSAELYADLKPSNEGLEGFLKDSTKNAMLFVTKDQFNKLGNERYKLKLLLEGDGAYIFTK